MYLKENMSVNNYIELIKEDFRDGRVLANVLYGSAPSTLIELQTAMCMKWHTNMVSILRF